MRRSLSKDRAAGLVAGVGRASTQTFPAWVRLRRPDAVSTLPNQHMPSSTNDDKNLGNYRSGEVLYAPLDT